MNGNELPGAGNWWMGSCPVCERDHPTRSSAITSKGVIVFKSCGLVLDRA